MGEYTVTAVRKALSDDATHRHISDVFTQGAIRFTRQEVIDSIRAGNRWKTFLDGHAAEIHITDSCAHTGCHMGPYLATDPASNHTLENLEPP